MKKRTPSKCNWTTVVGAKPTQAKDGSAAERTAYRKEAAAFIAAAIARGETCPVVNSIPELRDGIKYGWKISNKLSEVHHTHGRRGRLLRYKPWWLALSRLGHRWVHQHPKEARERGWLCPAGQWNEQSLVPKHNRCTTKQRMRKETI